MRGIRVGYPSPRAVRGSGPGFLRLTAPFELPVRQDGKWVEKRAGTDLEKALRNHARLRPALLDNRKLPKGIYKRGSSYYVRLRLALIRGPLTPMPCSAPTADRSWSGSGPWGWTWQGMAP